jgi:hypothetical protein
MGTCSRCTSKSVTPIYPAKSDLKITDLFAKKAKISNPLLGAFEKKIETCNGCTSPESRIILHNKNVFKRYEFQFLNLILMDYSSDNHYNIELNKVNKSDNKRYDAWISHTNKDIEHPTILNIEVDEFGHYTNKNYFKEDREKEKNFFKVNSKNKAYILRIRIGEKNKSSCISKDKTCKVKNPKLFDKNMKRTREYMKNIFKNSKKLYKIAYIDFSKDENVKEYPYKTLPISPKTKL